MTNSIDWIKGPEPVAGLVRQARVDFVIAGAPKCGTTALYSYLATHPQIAMSSRKEPYFWCSDIPIPSPVTDPTAYASLWTGAPGARLRGEATPAYLRSAVAGPAILRANPDAKFILLLRNPADMAVSFHAQMLVALQEDVADFESAWSLQAPRQRGERLPLRVLLSAEPSICVGLRARRSTRAAHGYCSASAGPRRDARRTRRRTSRDLSPRP